METIRFREAGEANGIRTFFSCWNAILAIETVPPSSIHSWSWICQKEGHWRMTEHVWYGGEVWTQSSRSLHRGCSSSSYTIFIVEAVSLLIFSESEAWQDFPSYQKKNALLNITNDYLPQILQFFLFQRIKLAFWKWIWVHWTEHCPGSVGRRPSYIVIQYTHCSIVDTIESEPWLFCTSIETFPLGLRCVSTRTTLISSCITPFVGQNVALIPILYASQPSVPVRGAPCHWKRQESSSQCNLLGTWGNAKLCLLLLLHLIERPAKRKPEVFRLESVLSVACSIDKANCELLVYKCIAKRVNEKLVFLALQSHCNWRM